jgi:hypothetical protein
MLVLANISSVGYTTNDSFKHSIRWRIHTKHWYT